MTFSDLSLEVGKAELVIGWGVSTLPLLHGHITTLHLRSISDRGEWQIEYLE